MAGGAPISPSDAAALARLLLDASHESLVMQERDKVEANERRGRVGDGSMGRLCGPDEVDHGIDKDPYAKESRWKAKDRRTLCRSRPEHATNWTYGSWPWPRPWRGLEGPHMAKPSKKQSVREWSDAGPIGSVAEAKWQGEQLSFRVDVFLRSRGWKHTSSTPGSYWLWGKTIDGKTLWVDQAHALGIESSQEPDDIDGDEEELGG
jgi:hypothetical protein